MELGTKNELLQKLRSYATAPDEHGILWKEKIKNNLMNCPELLFALNNSDYEDQLFDEQGNIMWDGEWDRYFGPSSSIRPFIFYPATQTEVRHYLSYTVSFDSIPSKNRIEKYAEITFKIYVDGRDGYVGDVGVPRHDLIASIIRERFNWSNIFGVRCNLISCKEGLSDNFYITSTLVFQTIAFNSIVNTVNGETRIITHDAWKE